MEIDYIKERFRDLDDSGRKFNKSLISSRRRKKRVESIFEAIMSEKL